MKKDLILVSAFLLLVTAQSFGKERIGLGFKASSVPSVGAIFHLTKHFAVRPSIGFSTGSIEDKTEWKEIQTWSNRRYWPVVLNEDYSEYRMGLGLMYFFSVKCDLRLYSGIEFGYGIQKLDTIYRDENLDWEYESRSKGRSALTSFLFGMQYRISKNIRIFGEAGYGYIYSRLKVEDLYMKNSIIRHQWGLYNSGIGVHFYF